jgi:hypothetical protein
MAWARFAFRMLTMAIALLTAATAGAETFDLYLRSFCSPGSNCGSPSEAEYRLKLLNATEHLNRQWRTTGISFRPVIFPIDSSDPEVYGITGCAPKDKRNPFACSDDSDRLCSDNDPCDEPATCAPQEFCADLTTTCLTDSDCVAAGGECLPLNSQQRMQLNLQLAVPERDAITLLLFEGSNKCCSNPPSDGDPDDSIASIYCDGGRDARDSGSIFAHEMGHYWCLRHVFSGAEWADGQAAPDHDYADIPDTPADPKATEGEDRTPRCTSEPSTVCEDDAVCSPSGGTCDREVYVEGHDFCDRTVVDPGTDIGSTYPSYCTSSCKRCMDGTCGAGFPGNTIQIPYEPDEHNAMSYWGVDCRAPFSVGGRPYVPLTPGQIDGILQCRSDWQRRVDLPDVCAATGGDSDRDGICQDDDNCPWEINTAQTDLDGDGEGDACDLCPEVPVPTGDLDGDGVGDACDIDRDNDGCLNDTDQDPDEPMQVVGTIFLEGPCESDQVIDWGYTGEDTDGDGAQDCWDVDDDDDGICDDGKAHPPGSPGATHGCSAGPDPCPTIVGTECATFVPGNDCLDPWQNCVGGSCSEYFSLLAPIGNPDPTATLRLDDILIYNQTLYARAPAGQTPATTALQIAGALGGGGSSGPGEKQSRLELWRNGGAAPEAILIDAYTPSEAVLGELNAGRLVAIEEFVGDVVREVRIRTVWAPGFVATDDDDDGIPAFADNCRILHNPQQRDNDGDGFGNLCDGDVDNDGDVDEEDFAAVIACDGVDLTREIPMSEPVDYDLNAPVEPDIAVEMPDAATIEELVRCRPLDLTGDRLVDYQDRNVLEASGPFPGPSGLVNRPPVAEAGADFSIACGDTFGLSAAGSYDPDGDSLACAWSSPTCNVTVPDSCSTSATCPPGGLHSLLLEVYDGTQSGFDEVLVDGEECSPGRVGNTLLLGKDGAGSPYLEWDQGCSVTAQNYAVYAGDLADPFGTLAPIDCNFARPPVAGAAPFENSVYIVVPWNDQYEGSFGLDSNGVERPFPDDGSPRCRQNQAVAACQNSTSATSSARRVVPLLLPQGREGDRRGR